MNELECIRAFVKVVEAGSFAEAARQTETAKSVITKRVNQLEEHLELQLLQRSTRNLTITEGGAEFYDRSIHFLSVLDQAKAAVSSAEWGLTGTLKVSCISSFASRYLANDLCEFQEEHPDLKLELQLHDRICDPVQEGFDVCLQVSQKQSNVLEKTDILPMRRLIAATPGYIKKHGRPERPEDLNQHKYAHNSFIESNYPVRFVRPAGRKAINVEPAIFTNSIWMLYAAVMSDRYVSPMPVFFIEKELTTGELVPLLPETELEWPVLSAYHRRSEFVPMKVRIFINFLRKKYGEVPPWEKRLLAKRPELAIALGAAANG